MPVRMAMMVARASTPPAAPSKWPVTPLVLDTIRRAAWEPKTVCRAAVSVLSFCGVLVPWALTYWTWSGSRPALRSACRMQRAAPSP